MGMGVRGRSHAMRRDDSVADLQRTQRPHHRLAMVREDPALGGLARQVRDEVGDGADDGRAIGPSSPKAIGAAIATSGVAATSAYCAPVSSGTSEGCR